MITGKYPFSLGTRTISTYLDSSFVTLAEVLALHGYFTCALAERWGEDLFQGLEQWNRISQQTSQKTQWCLETLDQLDGRPFFIWLYYWDPHAPYTPPVEFMRMYEPDYTWEAQKPYSHPKRTEKDDNLRDSTGLYGGSLVLLNRANQGTIVLTAAEREHLVNLYDAEIAFVDSKIKEVVDKIKELGLWDNTLVVLNADHGEAFGEHHHYYHGHTLHEEQVRVPLIVKPPQSQVPGKVVYGPVRNMDIMPTILDYCGIRPPQSLDGQSLRPFIAKDGTPELATYLETYHLKTQTHMVAYRDGQHKLIYNLSHDSTELYDLVADPQERENLLSQIEAPLEVQLREELLSALGVESLGALELSETSIKINPSTRERLRALGYIY
jgi:arylsulfatase A-like enzyme